jgi:hypothetical protein
MQGFSHFLDFDGERRHWLKKDRSLIAFALNRRLGLFLGALMFAALDAVCYRTRIS